MLKLIILCFFRVLVTVAYWVYRIEGVNALLLVMPAKLITPTLRKFGATIGTKVTLHSPLTIHNAGEDYRNLVIGNDVYFGREVFLDLKDKIIIGDKVTISMRATFITHTDVGESKIKDAIPVSKAPIRINSDAYLGACATVLQGVVLGEAAVVGAGSLVLYDVPANTVVAGNPAREIKKI